MTPEEETLKRIEALGVVGKALSSTSDEISYQTVFFDALIALNEFEERIQNLDLPEESRNGIQKLVEYLKKKINRRLKSSENESYIPTT